MWSYRLICSVYKVSLQTDHCTVKEKKKKKKKSTGGEIDARLHLLQYRHFMNFSFGNEIVPVSVIWKITVFADKEITTWADVM